jgi:myo-inositol-1(or 4)-monophosphatase
LYSHEGIENVRSELEAALSAAKQAGEVLRAGFGAEHAITYKGEVDLVTEADREAERLIREELLGTFPTYGILAEEGGELAGEEDARWIVDPLDGTTNYAHGLPIFAVSIALERSGEVVLGVVHDPMHEETYVAERRYQAAKYA